MIPLSYFVDRSDLTRPKGFILSTGKLSSPLKNPLTGKFDTQLLFDMRFRDCANEMYCGLSFNQYFTDHACGHPFIADNGNNQNILFYDDDGFYINNTTSSTFVNNIFNSKADGTGSYIDQFNVNGKRTVLLVALKIKQLPTTMPPLNVYFINAAGSVFYGFLIDDSAGSIIARPGHSGTAFKTFNSNDVDKWHLIVMTKETTNAITFRWLGGSTTTLSSSTGSTSGDTHRVRIPLTNMARIGFVASAVYTGTNDAGATGIAQADINYELFDEEHVCDSYATEGNSITFEATGEVAWQFLNSNNTWVNEEGGTDLIFNGSRGETNQFTFEEIGTFQSIRPVLKNYGLMFADENSTLNSVNVYTKNTRIAKLLWRSTLSASSEIDRRSSRFLISHSDSDLYVAAQWQIYNKITTESAIYDVITPIENGSSLLFSSNKFELNIVLPERTSLKLRVRLQDVDGTWGYWSNYFEFVTPVYRDFNPFATIRAKKIMTRGATLNFGV